MELSFDSSKILGISLPIYLFVKFSLFLCFRDPMDMMFVNEHFIRSPLRLYSEVDAENNNSLFSAAMMEKARAQLQMWGRAGGGYSPADLHTLLLTAPQMYVQNRGLPMPLPAHLWVSAGSPGPASPWTPNAHPGLPPGLLGPPPAPSSQLTPPPASSSSSGSPSPSASSPSEARVSRPIFPGMAQHRFSPYSLGSKLPSPSLPEACSSSKS